MRYTVLPTLWQRLADEERGLRWLARKAAVDNSVLSLTRAGFRKTVNERYAVAIAAVFNEPVGHFFSPVSASTLADSTSQPERVAAA